VQSTAVRYFAPWRVCVDPCKFEEVRVRRRPVGKLEFVRVRRRPIGKLEFVRVRLCPVGDRVGISWIVGCLELSAAPHFEVSTTVPSLGFPDAASANLHKSHPTVCVAGGCLA